MHEAGNWETLEKRLPAPRALTGLHSWPAASVADEWMQKQVGKDKLSKENALRKGRRESVSFSDQGVLTLS